jgi:hypothetical protein
MFTNEPDDLEELLVQVELALDAIRNLREEDVKHHLDHIEFFIEVLYDGHPEPFVPNGRRALCDVVDFQSKDRFHTN